MSARNGLPATIRTDRLVLRLPNSGDLPRLVDLLGNWKVVEPTAVIPFPYTEDDGRAFLNTLGAPGKAQSYAIAQATDDSLLGVVGMKFMENEPPELGYWLGEPFWGQGIVPEAASALLRATSNLGIPEVRARVLAHNEGSIRVLEKCGFRLLEHTTSKVERHLGKPLLIMSWSAP
ncbi:GNAT family N-acetyltransferase [Devosia submarina]|uniref:GNAT family N-acetyltransferase n=1 Tax=Devosia submarina TaxID=1173082 RepID=UPI000D35436F|nr:GNAT family N-acetyltransferase [Devosia submarina]